MTTRDPKRSNGTGSVEVLADGRARVRVMVDGKRRQVGPIYPDRDTARRMLAAWLAERGDGTIVAASELTLATYGEQWLDRRELTGSSRRERVKSIAGERSVWARQVMTSPIASMPLGAIRPRDVQAFVIELRGRKALHAITRGHGSTRHTVITETARPLSKSQQCEALRLVRGALDSAVLDELIERNPAEGIEVGKVEKRERDLSEDWLRWPEVMQLLECEELPARDRRAYACAIGLSLRLCDLKAIEVSRVELDSIAPGPGVTVWVSKSQKWHRVPIMPWLAPVIREQLASIPKGSRWLFPNEAGEAYAKHYDFRWAENRERIVGRDGRARIRRTPSALEIAGVARRVRFHDLRGTCATHLALGTWGRRWSLHEIQAMLAHSDQRVTQRYVRRAVDTLAEAAKATAGCPALPMSLTGGRAASGGFSRTPGPGLEPGTNRLTAPRPRESSREVTPSHGQPVGNRAHALAREVIELAADGSPHALRRALELAAVVLESAPAVRTRTAGDPRR